MSIRKSLGGKSIRKPGAYSRSRQDNSGGAPLGTNDTILLIGESDLGKPGAVEGITEWPAERLSSLVEAYGSGPIVDQALVAVRPSPDPAIGGAGRILVWKTNATTQAQASLNEATDTNPAILVKDRAWGLPGNNLSITVAAGTTSRQKQITVNRLNDTSEALGENAGAAVLSIQYTGDATTASAAITGATKAAKVLAVTLAGDQNDGSANLSITLANYTMKQLVDLINSTVGYSASLSDNSRSAVRSNELDPIGATSVKTAQSLYRLQEELVALINTSERVEASLAATPVAGVLVNVSNKFLTGGAKGASSNANFSTGMAKALAMDLGVMVPAVSRDATEDIADGLTDASSTYTISAIGAALTSALLLRSDLKNRKEAQGMMGFRNASLASCVAFAESLGSELVQVAIQDILTIDQNTEEKWCQPHVFAAMMAGIRLGTEIGEPLTHKRVKVLGVGHVVDPATGLETGGFNTALDMDVAIDAGITFSEKNGAGHRIVVDNTTYGADQSFVFNRGSVMEAAQYSAKTIRETAELLFVGRKVSNGAAVSIKNAIRAKLIELNVANIITASDDAPQGFVEETFIVQIQGNTCRVQVEIKPVQGLDFIFIDFTLGDITQSA